MDGLGLPLGAAKPEPSDPSSWQTEQRLVNLGFAEEGRIFQANQALVDNHTARVAKTSLVEYTDDSDDDAGLRSTAGLVASMSKMQSQREAGVVSLSESWTDEALRYLRRERHADQSTKLAALNYANCSYIGGNYSDGGYVRAQEEEMCRLFPALFASMGTCPEAGCKWSEGRVPMCMYSNHVFGARFEDGYSKARNVLFTEEVECLRGPIQMGYRLLTSQANRIEAGFVEAAAPLFNRGLDESFESWRSCPSEWYEKVFLNIFWAPKSIDPSYDVIVVGPWGCGAFGNDPRVVARSIANVIKKHDLLAVYKEIHFCLGRSMKVDDTVGGACNTNVDVFRSVLATEFGDSIQDYTADLQDKAEAWMKEEMLL